MPSLRCADVGRFRARVVLPRGDPMTGNDKFCDECAVSMDLHDGPDSCESAKSKARMLGMFWSATP